MSSSADYNTVFSTLSPPIKKWGDRLNMQRFAGLSVTLAGLMLYAGPGTAESWQNAVSARVSTEYDTNPAMDPTYVGGIWRFRVEPGYTLTRASDANELKAGLGVLVERTSDKTLSQNREDPSVFLDWRHQAEKGVLGMSARYDEVATRFSELDRAGVVLTDGTSTSRTVSASWSRELGERTTLAVDGGYRLFMYKGGTFVDYSTKTAGLMFSYAWSEVVTPSLKVSYIDYAPADGGLIDRRYSAMLGLKWKPSERLDLTVQGGQSQGEGATNKTKQGGMAAQYTGELAKWALNADREVTPSGVGGFIVADQVTGNWSYDMSERGKIGIDLVWRRSHFGIDSLYRTAGAWLQRELSPNWGMRTYYLRKSSAGDGLYSASENILGFSLAYANTNF